MCFKRAEVAEIVPDVFVCKACRYALNKQLDFFAYYGYGLQKLSVIGIEGVNPQGDEKLQKMDDSGKKAPTTQKEGVKSTKTPTKT